jgi:hypothetical protein
MILLVESAVPAEVEKDGKKCFISGLFLSNQPNKNNRQYSQDVLDEAVSSISQKLSSNSVFGELGHSSSMSIDPNRVAVMVKSLKRHPMGYYGRSEVLDTNAGKNLKSILNAGGRMGVSSRGSGETRKNREGLLEVSKFNLVSLDVVAEPSTGELFQHVYEAVLTEETKAQESRRGNKLTDENLRSRSAEIIQNLMAMLRNAGPEVLAAQNANSVDFDRDVMPFTNPLDSRTYLEIAQDDRARLVNALMKVARDIASQNDSGTRPEKYSAYADFLDKHAKKLTRDNTTRDPFRRAAIRREEARQRAGKRLIEAACELMNRPSNLSTSAPNTLIEGIRAKSGTHRDSTQNEIDAIHEYNKQSRRK